MKRLLEKELHSILRKILDEDIHSFWDVNPLFCSSFRPPPPPVSGLIKHENRIIGPSEQPLPPDPWVNYYQTRMNWRNLRISRCDSILRWNVFLCPNSHSIYNQVSYSHSFNHHISYLTIHDCCFCLKEIEPSKYWQVF